MIFNQTKKMLRKFENNLNLHSKAVLEKFYHTSVSDCNSAFTKEHQAPCRHIVFLHSNNDEIEILEITLFHKRYHGTILGEELFEGDELKEDLNEKRTTPALEKVMR